MKLRKLQLSEIKKWYKENLSEDFPVNEIKPLDNIEELHKAGRYDIYVYEKNGIILGYATIWKRKGLNTFLLDYLGVPSSMRNEGIGRLVLKQMRKQLCDEMKKRSALYDS